MQVSTEAVAADPDSDEGRVFKMLAAVASYHLNPQRPREPYDPFLVLADGGRSHAPADINEERRLILEAVAPAVPHVLLRARIYDVLTLLVSGADRAAYAVASVESVASYGDAATDPVDGLDEFDRAIDLAKRFGPPCAEALARLERQLVALALGREDGYDAVRCAELLREHGLAAANADAITERLTAVADAKDTDESEVARKYREEAATWLTRFGHAEEADAQRAAIVTSMAEEAATLGEDTENGTAVGRAVHLNESALAVLRKLSKRARIAHGLEALDVELRKRLFDLHRTFIDSMHVYSSDPIDLTELATSTRTRLEGREPLDALIHFVGMYPLPSFSDARERAKSVTESQPLASMFDTVHFDNAGRVVKRTPAAGNGTTYGIDSYEWRQLVRDLEAAAEMMVVGHVEPGRQVLEREHRLTPRDMRFLTDASLAVPPGRDRLWASGLSFGLTGDYSTAAHLLAPQIEHFVRYRLKQAGALTTHLADGGVEQELGLGGLAEKTEFVEVFDEDFAYTVRALMCDAAGPNLRNDIAHGLMPDSTALGFAPAFLWWLALWIVLMGYIEGQYPPDQGDDAAPSSGA